MEYKCAVQPVGYIITGQISEIEGKIVIGNGKCVKPGKKCSVECVYAAYNQE